MSGPDHQHEMGNVREGGEAGSRLACQRGDPCTVRGPRESNDLLPIYLGIFLSAHLLVKRLVADESQMV